MGLLLALQREELLGVSGVGGAYGPHGVADGGLHVREEGGWACSSANSARQKCWRRASSSVLGGREDHAAKKGRKKAAGCASVSSGAQLTS